MPTVNTDTFIQGDQQSYEIGKTNDLGFALEYHSQLTDAERYGLLTSDGPKNVALFDIIRQNCRKFLKAWLEDDRLVG